MKRCSVHHDGVRDGVGFDADDFADPRRVEASRWSGAAPDQPRDVNGCARATSSTMSSTSLGRSVVRANPSSACRTFGASSQVCVLSGLARCRRTRER